MKFDLDEKRAIVKALDEVIMADGHVKLAEVKIMNKLSGMLNFDISLIQEAREIDARKCMTILQSMPGNKKHALSVLLSEVANADGSVNEKELGLISGLLKAIDNDPQAQ